jgi:hypothetical protein
VFSQIVQSNLNFTYAGTVIIPQGIRPSVRTPPTPQASPTWIHRLHRDRAPSSYRGYCGGLCRRWASPQCRAPYVLCVSDICFIYVSTGCYMCSYECCKVDLVLSMLQWLYMYVASVYFECFSCFRYTPSVPNNCRRWFPCWKFDSIFRKYVQHLYLQINLLKN